MKTHTEQAKQRLRNIGRLCLAAWRAMGRRLPPSVVLIMLAIVAVPVLIWLPGWMAPDLADPQAHFEVHDRARLTLATIILGLVVLLGLYLSWRRVTALENQVANAQQGQMTERFTRAIDQLGAVSPGNKPAEIVRTGGVISLEQITKESDVFRWPSLEILSTHLKDSCLFDFDPFDLEAYDSWKHLPLEEDGPAQRARFRTDVRATVAAIERIWPSRLEEVPTPLNLAFCFVERIALPEKNLKSAHLEFANLERADLREADLREADLEHTNLRGADLRGADLREADLEHTNLREADLREADLEHTNLRGADLREADLEHTNLRGADLREADLDGAILNEVAHDQYTVWPYDFKVPPSKKALDT